MTSSMPASGPTRRTFIGAAALAVAGLHAVPGHAKDDDFPSRPIRLLVGGPAGGTEDIVARAIGQQAGKSLGQPFVVENRSGAGGTPAYLQVKRAAPDGYTLGLVSLSVLRQPILEDVGYDALKDFSYVSMLTDVVFCVVVPGDSPFHSWSDLRDYGRREPQKVSYGAPAGLGNSAHLFGAEVASREGVQWTPVPFRGSSDTMTALLGGQLTFSVDTIVSAAPMEKAGKVRILAFATDVAPKSWPGIPTMRQLGYDLSIDTFFGIAGPAHLDPKVLQSLDQAFRFTTEQPDFIDFLARTSQRTRYMGSTEFTAFVVKAEQRQRELLNKYGLAKARS